METSGTPAPALRLAEHHTLPDSQIIAIARANDYFFRVHYSRVNERWSLRRGTWLGIGHDPCYTPTTTIATFPSPWRPGQEPPGDRRIQAIAHAARELVGQRDRWLNSIATAEDELQTRTLTALYNQQPMWLELATRRLDTVVLEAYGWDSDIADDEMLARPLALNVKRSGGAPDRVDRTLKRDGDVGGAPGRGREQAKPEGPGPDIRRPGHVSPPIETRQFPN